MTRIEEYEGVTFSWTGHADGAAFYALLGPVFADPAFRKDMGGPINSGPDYVWIVGVDGAGALAAFAAFAPKAQRVWLTAVWVRPDLRRRGIYGRLADWRLGRIVEHTQAAGGAPTVVRACCNPASLPALSRRGFNPYEKKGQWSYVEAVVGIDLVGNAPAADALPTAPKRRHAIPLAAPEAEALAGHADASSPLPTAQDRMAAEWRFARDSAQAPWELEYRLGKAEPFRVFPLTEEGRYVAGSVAARLAAKKQAKDALKRRAGAQAGNGASA